ncbi:hypothetical protein BD410DRAFT_154174 [Rickenella mellea]|uniref:Uncharacterized protein n=1 Tax=Rickenella mellea TaxID=50990 RepID=A0A4Y7PIA4_9AGAM|nr:hypothetical protein BD410DRAFT_154174 [Rickenella mellea]
MHTFRARGTSSYRNLRSWSEGRMKTYLSLEAVAYSREVQRGFSLGSWLSNVQSMFYSPAVHHERPRLVATVDADGRASYWDPKKKPINIQEPRIEKFIIVNVETTDATVESPWTFLPHLIHYASDVPVHPNKTKALLVLFSDAMAGSGMGSEFEDKIFQVMTWLYCAVIQWKQAGLLHCILNEKKISDTLARISDEVCKMTSQLSPPSMTSAQLAISLERDESHLLKTIVNVLNCKKQVKIVRESGPQGFTSIRESVERFRLRWKTAMAAEQVNGAPKFMRFFLICQRILSWLAKHIVGFSCPTNLDGRVKIGRFFTGGGGGDIYTGSFDEIDKVALKTSRSYRKVNEANTVSAST